MRKQIVAGNWKMNTNLAEGIELCSSIIAQLGATDKEVIIGAPYIHLASLVDLVNGSPVKLAGQNCHQENSGAYTGEISAKMLASLGLDYVILGHSERRAYFAENNQLLAQKIDASLSEGLKVIYCCGETLEERKSASHFEVVSTQIEEALYHLEVSSFVNIVLAYEPVWAIGTGETATSAQAQEMHAHIRSVLADKYGTEIANNTSILYGGSCKPSNAEEIFSQADVDGGLIGGASLKAEDFIAIIKA